MLVSIVRANIHFNGVDIIDVEDMTIYEGDIIGIIGKNGAGKSSLLKLISGQLEFASSQIERRADFSYLPQIQETSLPVNDVDNGELLSLLSVPKIEYRNMSGGEKQKTLLSAALSQVGKVLLLDEPTTYLDSESREWLIDYLKYMGATAVLVSHDRELLNCVCNKIWAIENKTIKEYNGDFDDYLNQLEIERKSHQSEYEKYLANKKKLSKAFEDKQRLAKKMARVDDKKRNRAIKPNRLSSSKQKDTVQKSVYRQAKSILNRMDKLKEVMPVEKVRKIVFPRSEMPKIHNHVPIMVYNGKIEKQDKAILRNINFQVPFGKVIGVVGSNGSGKTSFLEYITNRNSEGVEISSKAVFGIYEQYSHVLKSEKDLLSYCQYESNYSIDLIKEILEKLGFDKQQLNEPVNSLSGGEAAKLSLAITFMKPSNIIILDEPTNFLDIFAINGLEELIKEYPGSIITASHDTRFILNVADIVYEIDSGVMIQSK